MKVLICTPAGPETNLATETNLALGARLIPSWETYNNNIPLDSPQFLSLKDYIKEVKSRGIYNFLTATNLEIEELVGNLCKGLHNYYNDSQIDYIKRSLYRIFPERGQNRGQIQALAETKLKVRAFDKALSIKLSKHSIAAKELILLSNVEEFLETLSVKRSNNAAIKKYVKEYLWKVAERHEVDTLLKPVFCHLTRKLTIRYHQIRYVSIPVFSRDSYRSLNSPLYHPAGTYNPETIAVSTKELCRRTIITESSNPERIVTVVEKTDSGQPIYAAIGAAHPMYVNGRYFYTLDSDAWNYRVYGHSPLLGININGNDEDSGQSFSQSFSQSSDDEDYSYLAPAKTSNKNLSNEKTSKVDFTLGLELELESDNRDSTIRFLRNNLPKGYCLFKSDASLREHYGFELMSAALTLKSHKAAWAKLMDLESKDDSEFLPIKAPSGYGLHVHIDAKAFSPLSLRVFNAFWNNPENSSFIDILCGRHPKYSSEAANYAAIEPIPRESIYSFCNKSYIKSCATSRYRAVNLTTLGAAQSERLMVEQAVDPLDLKSLDTVEVRICASSSFPTIIYARIELIHALVTWSKNTSLKDTSFRSFVSWLGVSQSAKKYGYLRRYINNFKRGIEAIS